MWYEEGMPAARQVRKDLINAEFPMLNSHPRGHALCGRCSSRMAIEHWELSIGQISG
jgi:hypothetical protein